MPSRERFYWDACVFLSYINGEPSERLIEIDPLLDQAGTGQHDIFTSTLSVVEVAFAKAEQDGQALDAAVGQKLDDLWKSTAVQLVEFYRLIAEDGRSLMREALTRGWSMKAGDAIHLATARRMSVSEFHTYDDKLFKFSPLTGFPIQAPIAAQLQLPGAGL